MRVLVLGSADADLLNRVVEGVFDHAIRRNLCEEFLADPRHHLAVALDEDVMVVMASGVHYCSSSQVRGWLSSTLQPARPTSGLMK